MECVTAFCNFASAEAVSGVTAPMWLTRTE